MEPVPSAKPLPGRSSESHDAVEMTSWVSVSPRGPWRVHKQLLHQKCGYAAPADTSHLSNVCPRLGSLCQVCVRLKDDSNQAGSPQLDKGNENVWIPREQAVSGVTNPEITDFPRCQSSVLQVPLGVWVTIRLGEGQCDITEACVEGMRAGEICEIRLSPVEAGSDGPAEDDVSICATVELHSFTAGKETWEMHPSEKLELVRSHKQRGGTRFRSGDVWGAADSYSQALKLLITLHGHFTEAAREFEMDEEETQPRAHTDSPGPSASEYQTLKAELHANLSLCQLKLEQPERAKASAARATKLEPTSAKAWYRLGQASQMVNELGEARQAFSRLLQLQPDSPAALKALRDIANKEKETNTQLGLRLSKMFS